MAWRAMNPKIVAILPTVGHAMYVSARAVWRASDQPGASQSVLAPRRQPIKTYKQFVASDGQHTLDFCSKIMDSSARSVTDLRGLMT